MKNVIIFIVLIVGVALFIWLRSDNMKRAQVQPENNTASVREIPQEQTRGYNETFKMSPSMYPAEALQN